MSLFDNLDHVSCAKCGCIFGVPTGFLKNRLEDKREFFCPNGHQLSYRESTAQRLQRELDRAKQRTAMLEDEAKAAQARADKANASTKRLKKRMSAGTCPCCKRTFGNMAEHMKHQHPEFVSEGGAKVVPLKRA